MWRVLCWLALLTVSVSVHCQSLTISSKVTDQETGEPLPFASIGIRGKPIGTVANLQGEFDFHFPAEYRNDLFVISMMGYLNFEMPVWTVLESKQAEITLTKSNTILNTIVVSDTLRGGDILLIALNRLDLNYADRPFMMDGFYRDFKKIGGTYVSLLEAAVQIYDEDHYAPRNKYKLRERVRLLEVRRSLGYDHRFTSWFDQDNLLEDMLLHNNIRYRQFPEELMFFASLNRDKDSNYDNRDVFVVSHHKDFDLTIFIDKKTYGILHLEYQNNSVQAIGKKRGLHSKFVGLKKVIDYKYFDDKLYLNYVNVFSRINWYDRDDKLKFETELEQQLLINHVFTDPEDRIGVTEKMRSYGLQYQDRPYNKKFWDEYNLIKESPLDKKIVADLELGGPTLEKQFEKN